MAKIVRYTGDVKAFGSNATGTDRTIFGDVTQSDLLNDNLNANYLVGWGVLAAGAKPPKEYFNGALFTATQLISYLFQQGIPEWDSVQEYHIDSSAIGSDGVSYISVINTNTANDPTAETDETTWKILANPYRGNTTTHNITVNADYTLTSLQNKNGRVVITDTGVLLTVARNIILDNVQKSFIFQNDTLQILTVKTPAGTGLPVRPGATIALYNDGTNVINPLGLDAGVVYVDPDAIGANPTAKIYPDGSVVGSTDNGSYEKKANGELIVRKFFTTFTPAANFIWTFPILATNTLYSFAYTSAATSGANYEDRTATLVAVTTTGVTFVRTINGASDLSGTVFMVMAIARWK